MSETPMPFDQWAILELMGHVRLAGRVTEEEHFGAKVGRIDVPGDGDTYTTQWFSGASIYRLTATTEAIARQLAKGTRPAPVQAWELPLLRPPRPPNMPEEIPDMDEYDAEHELDEDDD